MSNSPFEIFRKNLKPLMVFLIMLAMFSFVVLPALDTYLRQNVGTGEQVKVATIDGTAYSEGRVAYLTRNHNSTVRFLQELAEETIRRGGVPQTPGFQYDSQSDRIVRLGINQMPSELGSIKALQFAAEARKAGFQLDDTALASWLTSFTNGKLSDGEIDSLLMQSTRNQMGRLHLYEQLRNHLLADLYQRSGTATLAVGQMPILTPAEEWQVFLKLNREASVDAYGILVSDYLDQTNDSPSQAEIVAIYEKGKDVDPNDQLADPAFHRRYSAEFEYLVADLQTFVDQEAEKISEETLRAEYQRRLEGGDFKMPDANDPDAAMATGLETEGVQLDSPDAMEPETPEPETPEPETPEPETPEPEATAAPETTASESNQTDPAMDADQPADSGEPSPSQENSGEPDSPETTETSETTEAAEAEQDKQSQNSPARDLNAVSVRLVAFQENSEDTAAEDKPGEEPPAEDKPAEDAPEAEDKPSEEPQQELEAEPMQEDSAQEKTVEEVVTEEKSEPDPATEEPATEEPAMEPEPAAPTAETESETDGENAPEQQTEPEEPKVESFDDVRNRIADSLARPAAIEKLNAAEIELFSKMRTEFNNRAIYDSDVAAGKKVEPPKPLDLKALGESLGFRYEKIGPHTLLSIQDEPIASSLEIGSGPARRGPNFVTMMFGGATQQAMVPPQQLYYPIRTVVDQVGRRYVSRKIEETEAYTPELNEVRQEVILAIRMQEARKLALAAAEELAEKANASEGRSLAAVLPEEKKDAVQTGLGPFSWMDSFGFQGASIGNVPELDSVGEEFMRTVFNTEIGRYGVALNQPGRVVYVVKPTAFQPDIAVLKSRFKEPRERMMALFSGGGSVGQIWNGFIDAVDDRTNFTYVREDQ